MSAGREAGHAAGDEGVTPGPSSSGTGRGTPGRERTAELAPLRDRLVQAEAEWHDVGVGLEQQRSVVRAHARSLDETKRWLERARRDPAVEAGPEAVARLEGELEAGQAALEREVKLLERLLSAAERARTRLSSEMGRLREEIQARES